MRHAIEKTEPVPLRRDETEPCEACKREPAVKGPAIAEPGRRLTNKTKPSAV